MEPNAVAAASGLLGSIVGASASIATTWLSKRTEIVRSTAERRLREREILYNDFLTEASRAVVHALTHTLEGPEQIVALYGLLSRIRLIAGDAVVNEGEACCRRILETFGRPNMTGEQIRALLTLTEMNELTQLDPLKAFSNACRDDLRAIENRLYHRD